ncbi:hypothetical protein LRP30_33835 [Bradyrhizobium sp. C-145]|nr:hypothetical protein [Bradyrhizobium sp. C-145]UQR61745.1 hypothetical protein LRP30_33835 [Bradyrhizobium sp. C-145]
MNTTAINDTLIKDTVQDLGDATELTKGFGGSWRAEHTTGDYYYMDDSD